jgi:hypothetical protein
MTSFTEPRIRLLLSLDSRSSRGFVRSSDCKLEQPTGEFYISAKCANCKFLSPAETRMAELVPINAHRVWDPL